jgi:hypothetical protein
MVQEFYVLRKGGVRVTDAGGEILYGPFSEGTKEKGPWYPVSAVPSHYMKVWLKRGAVALKLVASS